MLTNAEIIARNQIFGDRSFLRAIIDSDKCVMPLYHGMDKRILSQSLQERQALKKACDVLIEYYHPIIDKFLEIHKYRDNPIPLMRSLIDCSSVAFCKLCNATLYQYDKVYLTGSLDKARNYARRAFMYGELGYVVKTFITACTVFKIHEPEKGKAVEEAYNKFQEFINDSSQPIVLVFQNIDKVLMKDERGEEINWRHVSASSRNDIFGCQYSFRVNELDFSKAIEVIEV